MTSDEATIRDDVADSTHDAAPAAAPGGETPPVPGQRAGLAPSAGGREREPAPDPPAAGTGAEPEPTTPPPAAAETDGEAAADPTPAIGGDGGDVGSTDEPTVHLQVAATRPAAPSADPWADAGTEVWQPPLGERPPAAAEPRDDDADWSQEYSDRDLFTSIVSAPALSLAAFAFAVAGLLGGMIPESLPYLVQMDEQSGPVQHIKVVAFITLGFAIVSASLGFAALLRSIGSALRWPRYLGGAAVLLAILIALQSALLLVLAALAPQDVPR